MKHLFKVFGMAAAILLLLRADGQGAVIPAYTAFSAGTTNPGTTLSWAITSAHSANDGVPAVTFLNAITDTTNSQVQFYYCDASCVETYATNSTTTLSVNTTNGIFDGGVVVIRHMASDTYEKRIASGSAAAATNLVLSVAPMTATIPGDIIYHMTKTGAPMIWVTTNSTAFAAAGCTVQQAGQNIFSGSLLNGHTTPVLAEISGAAKATLCDVTVQYLTPVTVPKLGSNLP